MVRLSGIKSKPYRKAIHMDRDVNHALGWDEAFYHNARGSRMVIYHGICLNDHTRFNPIFLKYKTIEQHFKFYKEYFNAVSVDDFYQQRFSNDKFNICITFDDGYANNYKHALYLVQKYQPPASFFVTAIRKAGYDILWNDFSGMVNKYGPRRLKYKDKWYVKDSFNHYTSEQSGERIVEILRSGGFDAKAEMINLLYPLFPYRNDKKNEDYWPQMTPAQIRELSLSPLAYIGSHGYYHNDLARININDAKKEMVRSKRYLEHIIDQPVNNPAFPYGSYTHDVVDCAKATGYPPDFLFAEDHSDPAMREQFIVNPFISTVNQMHATVKRRYE